MMMMGDWFDKACDMYVPGVFGYRKIAKELGLSVKTVESRFRREIVRGSFVPNTTIPVIEGSIRSNPSQSDNLDRRIVSAISKGTCSLLSLSSKFTQSESTIKAIINGLKEQGYDIDVVKNEVSLNRVPQEELKKSELTLSDGWHKIGVVSDTHLNSKYQQLTHLRNTYGIFDTEGCEQVFHSGDICAGQGMYKGQEYEIFNFGSDAQSEYAIENYPKLKNGGKTLFITGNHDLSFYTRSGVDIGKKIAMARPDMACLGQLGAYVEISPGVTIYLIHPDSGQCFDDITEIFTMNGWKFFKDLTTDDFVATMTKNNGEFQWQHPTDIVDKQYFGYMYNFKSRTVDMMVTPNHGMWTRINKWRNKQKDTLIMPLKSHKHENYEWKRVTAQDMYDGYCRQKWQLTNHSNSWVGNKNVDYVEVPYLEAISNKLRMVHVGKIEIGLFCELVAWYVTEGSTGKKAFNISQSKRVNPENHKEITDLLDNIGLNYCVSGKDCKSISISNKELAIFIGDLCGRGSRNKMIPDFLKALPVEYLWRMFFILIKGDGWINNKGYGYRSISKRLLDDVFEIAAKCGMSVTFNKRDTINISKIQKEPTINIKPQKTYYSGRVYCCKVDNGLILVRRNGKATWSHNSYAVSYKPQKIISGFRGGNKPNIMLIGHYHQSEYLFERNVHCIQSGAFEGQTPYLRRKGITPQVGGWMLEFKIEGGSVTRFKQEWITYFNEIEHDYELK